jgi:hypothetical protein
LVEKTATLCEKKLKKGKKLLTTAPNKKICLIIAEIFEQKRKDIWQQK